jgi:cysteine desulfurase
MTVYLDHNATTPPHEEVVEAMLPYLRGSFGNASSEHRVGRAARAAVETARERIAALVHSDPDEILLCGSGTEACNLALRGATRARHGGDRLVVSAIEHHAVGDTAAALAAEGLQLTRLPVDERARVDASVAARAVDDDTFLVSVMHANNEVGTIQPIAEIGALLADRDVVFHSDGVQSVGKIEVNVRRLGVDLLSMSGHKIHGPQGVGALFVRRGTPLEGILFGGAQEEGLRPGTYNLPGIVGMGKAAQIAARDLALDSAYVESLRDDLEAGLRRIAPDAVVLGADAQRLPGTALVAFAGHDNRSLAENLDLAGVAVSTGAACSAGSGEPSHVLAAMGTDPQLIRGTIRFSLGSSNSQQDVTEALDALASILASRRGRGPLTRALNAMRSVREGVSR